MPIIYACVMIWLFLALLTLAWLGYVAFVAYVFFAEVRRYERGRGLLHADDWLGEGGRKR